MRQSDKQLTVYTSRRLSLQRRNELHSEVSCNERQNCVNSYPNKRVTVKRKCEENSNKMVKRGRKKKSKKKDVESDEATRLQNRARYLLIKIKLERNLIEAYSTDGWKGQSREKIRPEKELERAEKEIIRCKLCIRDIVHQFDTLISSCKCDNNHQISSEPSFETIFVQIVNIVKTRFKILEAINAHLCTNFAPNSSFEDIFKEATNNPDYENKKEEWGSDESEDEDYSPSETDNNNIEEFDFYDSDWSTDPIYSTNDTNDNNNEYDLNECKLDNSKEILHQRRKRINVDYRKLHDEMFGKDAVNEEESSEDEDWGPFERKNIKRKESTPDIQVINSKTDKNGVVHLFTSEKHHKIQSSNMAPQVKETAKRMYSKRDVNRPKLRNSPEEKLKSRERTDCVSEKQADEEENACLDLLNKMCILQNRIINLKKSLVLHSDCAAQENMSQGQHVMFVPFAQLIEKKP